MTTDDAPGRTLLLAVAALILVAVLVPLSAMLFAMPMMGFGMGFWDGTPGATWPWLLALVVYLAPFLGIGYLLYRVLRGSRTRRTDPALEELRRAYARGDISSEEFEERRERLERGDRSR